MLSGPEEATYAALGVISGFFQPKGLAGDMGGGSLEVAEVVGDRVGERMVSMPLGTRASTTLRGPLSNPGVAITGAYHGEGADTRLLAAPTWHELGGVLDSSASVSRVLDLRTSILSEGTRSSDGRLEVTRLSSLSRSSHRG